MKVPFNYLDRKFEGAELVLERIRELLRRGDFTLGAAVTEFETKFAAMVGARHAIGVANGTDALRIALRLAGVGPGDEVITGAHSFVASVGAIHELFATPVLVDMHPEFWALDHKEIESVITDKTRAILPVHFTGMPAEMDAIMRIATKHRIPVIEDACQAAGATYRGKGCGAIGLAGAFSLHPLKVLNVWGDGGFITTNDDYFAERVRLHRNHNLIDRDTIADGETGCNSRLDTLQALVGLWLIESTPEAMRKRQANAAFYDEHLPVEIVRMPSRPNVTSCYHLYMVRLNASNAHFRDELVKHLNARGIEAKVHYPKMFQRYVECGAAFPVAYAQVQSMITLPVHEYLTTDQLRYVCLAMQEFFDA